jgi:hypothetical protein
LACGRSENEAGGGGYTPVGKVLAQGDYPMNNTRECKWSWWYLLLLIQFVPALWVPFYNSIEPSWAGIPFFYWFQMALILVSSAVTAVVYFATERAG